MKKILKVINFLDNHVVKFKVIFSIYVILCAVYVGYVIGQNTAEAKEPYSCNQSYEIYKEYGYKWSA